jgi:hypothetical protein
VRLPLPVLALEANRTTSLPAPVDSTSVPVLAWIVSSPPPPWMLVPRLARAFTFRLPVNAEASNDAVFSALVTVRLALPIRTWAAVALLVVMVWLTPASPVVTRFRVSSPAVLFRLVSVTLAAPLPRVTRR